MKFGRNLIKNDQVRVTTTMGGQTDKPKQIQLRMLAGALIIFCLVEYFEEYGNYNIVEMSYNLLSRVGVST